MFRTVFLHRKRLTLMEAESHIRARTSLVDMFAVMIDDGVGAGDPPSRRLWRGRREPNASAAAKAAALWRDVDPWEAGRLKLVIQRGHVLRENVFPALDQ